MCAFSLPEWVERVLNKERKTIELFTAIKYESFTHTTPMKKIKGGFEIKKIFDCLKNRTLSDAKPSRMFLYLTHGHVVVNILNTLNVYEVNAHENCKFIQHRWILICLFVFSSMFRRFPAAFILNCTSALMHIMCSCSTDEIIQSICDPSNFPTAVQSNAH